MQTKEFIREMQNIRKAYYDANKQKEPAKKELLLKAADENSQLLMERVKKEKVPGAEKYLAAIFNPSSASIEIPADAAKYDNFFDSKVYRELLLYCQLAYSHEQNGIPEEHALKLTVIFGNVDKALEYLAKYDSVHDACLFSLPSLETCNFKVWRELAARYLHEDVFKKIFAQADGIEGIIKEDILKVKGTGKKPDKAAVINLKNKIEKDYSEWRKLNRSQVERKKHKERYEELSQSLVKDKATLTQLRAGLPLESDMDLLTLQCYQERYIIESSESLKYMLSKGLSKKDFNKFLELDRTHAGENIPEMAINGESLGYPGFYLKKVNVLNEQEAARAACLGRLSNCCQSLSGEAGEPCAIHGLTSPNGGFYVLCKGDINHADVSDELIAQCWTWRSTTNAIVFDSIESALKDQEVVSMSRKFYRHLGKQLCLAGHTDKVACGAKSGISASVGVPTGDSVEQYKDDYQGYSDSSVQLGIFDRSKPYYFYEIDEDAKNQTHNMVEEVMKSQEDLAKSTVFYEMLNWAILNKENNPFLFNKISEMAKSSNKEQEYEGCLNVLDAFINQRLKSEEIISLVERGKLLVSAKDKENKTPLMLAAESGKLDHVLNLLEKGADVHAKDINGETALMKAGKLDIILKLIEQGADVKVKSNNGMTVLMHLVAKGEPAAVLKVIESISESQLEEKDNAHETALIKAARANKVDNALLLIEKGAKVDTEALGGVTALMAAAQEGQLEAVEKLIEKGADIKKGNIRGETSLIFAATMGHQGVVAHLLAKGADVNVTNNHGDSVLMLAAKEGHTDIVAQLLAKGADVNFKSREGYTALMLAAKEGHTDTVAQLLANGADYTIKSRAGGDALMLGGAHKKVVALFLAKIVGEDIEKAGFALLMKAAAISQKEVVTQLLAMGVGVNMQNQDNETPLMMAAKGPYGEIVTQLLAEGAEVNVKNKNGDTPLMMVVAASYADAHRDIIAQLLAKDALVNDQNNNGDTPLMIAAKKGQKEIVMQLLAKGADVNIKNKNGDTALMLAGNGDVVVQLLAKGADINDRNNQGNTALMSAAKRNNRMVVDKLLAKGADKNLTNQTGKNAISLTTDPFILNLILKHQGVLVKPKVISHKLIYSKLPLPPKPSEKVQPPSVIAEASTKKKPTPSD